MAEPKKRAADQGRTEVLRTSSSSEETVGAAGGLRKGESTRDNSATKKSSNTPAQADSVVKPKSEADGKFYIAPYDDPAKPVEEEGLIVRIATTIFDVIKYVFYFCLVLGIGFLAIYGVKLFTTKYNAITGGGHELLNILEVRYLAPGKAVCLVEVAGKVLVLGMTGNNINPLSELTDIEQVEGLKEMAARKPEPLQPFQAYLEKFSDRFTKPQKKRVSRSAKPVRKRRETPAESDSNHWRDDLKSTGENISKILEEIKKQDTKRPRGTDPTGRRGRSE